MKFVFVFFRSTFFSLNQPINGFMQKNSWKNCGKCEKVWGKIVEKVVEEIVGKIETFFWQNYRIWYFAIVHVIISFTFSTATLCSSRIASFVETIFVNIFNTKSLEVKLIWLFGDRNFFGRWAEKYRLVLNPYLWPNVCQWHKGMVLFSSLINFTTLESYSSNSTRLFVIVLLWLLVVKYRSCFVKLYDDFRDFQELSLVSIYTVPWAILTFLYILERSEHKWLLLKLHKCNS